MLECTFCHEMFDERLQYVSHMQYAHPGLLSFVCGVKSCLRAFKSFESFRKHMRSQHDTCNSAKRRKILQDSTRTSFPVASTSNDDNLYCSNDHFNETESVEVIEHTSAPTKSSLENNQLSNSDASEKELSSTQNKIVDNVTLLAAELHKHLDIPRKRTSEIINLTENFMDDLLSKVEAIVSKATRDSDTKEQVLKNMKTFHSHQTASFNKVNTEFKCLKTFRLKKTLIEPITFKVGKKKIYRRRRGIKLPTILTVTAEFIPIRHVLKCFFQIPGILDETLHYLKSAQRNSSVLYNFVQGKLWKDLSREDGDKIYFPVFISFDDYENNNPLGSHRGVAKCGAVYLSIPCLPPAYQSKLQNIFLFLLFNSQDRKLFHNKAMFSKVNKELEFLAKNGITIQQPSGNIQIYFRLGLLIADNLGFHEILGFGESFTQQKFCRFCLTNRININQIYNEEECTLRDIKNYDTHLKANDQKNTGVKQACILTGVNDFHPVQNISVDVVHDGLEGFCRYDLGLILNYFIRTKKYFSLQVLNNRIEAMNYGSIKNKPPKITVKHLHAKNVTMSASEMLTFVRFLSVIIGDLVPSDDETWNLYLGIKGIIEIMMSQRFHPDFHQVLQIEITEYLRELNRLFPSSMKPKHHFLIHYHRVLLTCGPLSKLSTFRFESKHREGKITSRAAISRVNVSKTIALKHQLKLNHYFLSNKLSPNVQYGDECVKRCSLSELNGITNVWNQLSDSLGGFYATVSTIKKFSFQGSHIEIGNVIMIPGENRPCLYEVVHIILHDDEKLMLVVKLLVDVFLDEHTQHYEIISSECTWKVLKCSQLHGSIITNIVDVPDIGKFIIKNWL